MEAINFCIKLMTPLVLILAAGGVLVIIGYGIMKLSNCGVKPLPLGMWDISCTLMVGQDTPESNAWGMLTST